MLPFFENQFEEKGTASLSLTLSLSSLGSAAASGTCQRRVSVHIQGSLRFVSC